MLINMIKCRLTLYLLFVILIQLGKGYLINGFSEGGFCSSGLSLSTASAEVSITSLFQIHTGAECNLIYPQGVQVLEAARWSVSQLNKIRFIPGVSLGIDVWDTCGTEKASLTAAVEAVVTGEFLEPPQCQSNPHAGIIISKKNTADATNFLKDTRIPYITLDHPDLSYQFNGVSSVLQQLNWTHVGVVSSSMQAIKTFSKVAAEYSICVLKESFLDSDYSNTKQYNDVMIDLNLNEILAGVFIGSQEEIAALLKATRDHHDKMDWLFVPTGSIQEEIFHNFDDISTGNIVVKRDYQDVSDFGHYFMSLIASGDHRVSLMKHYTVDHYVEEPSVIEVVKSVVKLASSIRESISSHCIDKVWCSKVNMTKTLQNGPQTDMKVINIMNGEAQKPKYQIMRLIPKNNQLHLTKAGYYYNNKLAVDMEILIGGNLPRPVEHQCSLCSCLNIRFAMFMSLKWRQDAWVTVSATLAIIGIVVATTICVFLISRSCRGSTQEGSQFFTILLLFAAIFLYLALLPYSFQASDITCFLRPFITGLAYSLVFSIMVARSLMLATADSEGLIGHVSGVVQCALFFFMMIVQIGLGLQQFLLQGSPLYSAKENTNFAMGNSLYSCSDDKVAFLFSLTYVIFLLLLQIILAPFIVTSRRNYHEGLLFFVATILVTGIWASWTTMYILLSNRWSDACICLGLAFTPTSLLIAIFIPKTYLMVKAKAIESVPPSILPLSRPQSIHDLTSSRPPSLAIYDSIGHIPEMTYASTPHIYSSREPSLIYKQSGYYEAYNPYTPSPRKVTVF